MSVSVYAILSGISCILCFINSCICSVNIALKVIDLPVLLNVTPLDVIKVIGGFIGTLNLNVSTWIMEGANKGNGANLLI